MPKFPTADFHAISTLLSNMLGLEIEKVTETSKLTDDLGADSLDYVELLMEFEEEFGVEIPDEAAEPFSNGTVGEIVTAIKNRQLTLTV